MAAAKALASGAAKGAAGLSEAVVSLFSALMAAALIIYGGYALYDSLYIQNQAYASSWDLQKYRPEIIDDDKAPLTAALAAENDDYRGWLTLNKTGIDYPVMQAQDDLYYASHDVFKKSSLTGALYLASGNKADFSDNYNLIYGHHMDANALFGSLDHYLDASYVEEHRTGVLVSRSEKFDLNVFAVAETTAYNNDIYKVGMRDLSALATYLSTNSVYYDAAAVEGATKVLAMSTCASAQTNGRLVVFAVVTPHNPGTPDTPAPTPGNPEPGNPTPGTPTPGTTTLAGTPTAATPAAAPSADAAAAPEPEVIADDENPLADALRPTGASIEDGWALINLLCVLITLFMLLPLGSLRDKYRRAKKMRKANEEGCSYNRERFSRRLTLGVALEVVVAIVAAVVFIVTSNFAGPMVLINMWTPLMLLFAAASVIIDVRLARYRSKRRSDDDDGNNGASTPQRQAVGA